MSYIQTGTCQCLWVGMRNSHTAKGTTSDAMDSDVIEAMICDANLACLDLLRSNLLKLFCGVLNNMPFCSLYLLTYIKFHLGHSLQYFNYVFLSGD